MVREGYPDTMEHKNFHIGLLDQFSSRAHMVTTDSSGTVLIDFLEFLTDWIFHHINFLFFSFDEINCFKNHFFYLSKAQILAEFYVHFKMKDKMSEKN